MGMGKTIQAIGLILANRPDARDAGQQRQRLQAERDHFELMRTAAAPVRRHAVMCCPVLCCDVICMLSYAIMSCAGKELDVL